MKYFKAPITIENSQKKYGKLPIGFVLGYENNDLNEAYFYLHEEVTIPVDSGIVEIDNKQYDLAVETINQLANAKRQAENEELTRLIAEKNRIIEELQTKVILTENALADLILGGM